MKKVVNKLLSMLLSVAMAIAMLPFSSGVSFAGTQAVTNNVKYFTTTMYNFDGKTFNEATTSKYSDTTKNFYFIGSNANEPSNRGAVSRYNGEKYLVQGIVKSSLENGQIVFNDNARNIGVFAPDTETVAGRTVYQNVQFPFNYNNGYYEFNGTSNHVHMSEINSTNRSLTLYEGKQEIGRYKAFFPFNKDGDSNPDYHFGMSMSVPFYMTSDGNDKNGKPIEFNFSGDDDVWVFINGKLVLDIGGIHGDIAASINFATGDITYKYAGDKDTNKSVEGTNISGGSLTTSTTLQNLGINMSDLTKGENNLQIYYLERGAGLSNCKIGFNLPQKDTLEISKELGENTPYTTSDFTFKVLKDNEPYANASYRLYTGSVLDPNENYKTDSNGEFSIKAGQRVNFVDNPTGVYQVIELTEGYETSWLAQKEGTSTGANIEGKNGIAFEVSRGEDGIVTKYTVNCTNSADVTLNDDSIVLDYGKPVEYNVRTNDNDSSTHGSTYGIGDSNLAKDTTKAEGYTGLNTDVTLSNGNIKIDEDGVVTYTPTKYMSTVDKANYAVSYKLSDNETTRYAYATINIMPASSVYYEDDFGTIENGEKTTVIKWSGTWDTVVDKDRTESQEASDNLQSSDNINYGWEKTYEDDNKYSDGSAHYSSTKGSKAIFTFTGTGVDVYSKTDSDVGLIRARIYNGDKVSGSPRKMLYIDNLSVSGDYYQIPTLFFDDLPYGTYTVEIAVMPAVEKDDGEGTRGTYYLDGIRVYNPLGVAPTDSVVIDAYTKAGEYNATFKTVRKILLDAKSFNADTVNDGAVFIDEVKDDEGNSTTNVTTSDVGLYDKVGPKNEVYLAKNQAIAFEINSGYNKLFVGAKSISGSPTEMTVTNGDGTKSHAINHASDMYYEIIAKDSGNKKIVLIKNTGDNILSITNLRATGENYSMSVTSSQELLTYANTFSLLSTSDSEDEGLTIAPTEPEVDIDNSNNDTKLDDSNKEESNSYISFWKKVTNSINKWFKI